MTIDLGARSPLGTLVRRSSAGAGLVLAAGLACNDPPAAPSAGEPTPAPVAAPAPAAPAAATLPGRTRDGDDAALFDRYPSLEHYPVVEAALRDGLERRDGPRGVLVGLAASMAPYRWPSSDDWDRHGFIDLQGARRGFVTRISGGLISQPSDRHDLGCAGGFLEGVRLTLLPRLAIEDLDRCDLDRTAVAGAPGGCDPEHEYGWLALANIAGQLRDEQLPAGRRLIELDPREAAALDRLAAPGAMHLCTVSHLSATHADARYYHHMMIVLGTPRGTDLEVFDTTGGRGVSLVGFSRVRFTRYCTALLRENREFKYRGLGTSLTCLPVRAV